ncbi:MAG TPA: hypothetical protein VJK47_02905 [Dehalococcoidales bacterium]|nr:hypothetical protein [Dehalococcoidales bacterium]
MEADKTGTPIVTQPKKSRSSLLQLTIVGAILAAIALSFGLNVLSQGAPAGVPSKLADMKLNKNSYVEGAQALARVNQLHGTAINLMSAYIAEYSHDFNPYHTDRARVTVWVGTAGSNDAATQLLNRMVSGIGNGNEMFGNMQQLNLDGDAVYQVSGAGGDHFFYQSRKSPDRVIWLTIAEAGNTMSIVEQALDEF